MHADRHLARDARAERDAQPGVRAPGGDMRTLRLERTFDVVFIHDAISYLTTEDDLRRRWKRQRSTCGRAASSSSLRMRRPRSSSRQRIMAATTERTDAAFATSSGRTRPTRRTGRRTSPIPRSSRAGRATSSASCTTATRSASFLRRRGRASIADAGLELVDTTVENPYELEQAASSPAGRA